MLNNEIELLASIIVRKLKEEFAIKHLSGNLMNTIVIESSNDGIDIRIPAQTYNMLKFMQKGVVIHTSHGSYASKLDEEGSSFMVYPEGTKKGSYRVSPKNHKGYVNKIIDEAIIEWNGQLEKYKIYNIEE